MPSVIDDYATTFQLKKIKFIAGDTYILEFTVIDEAGDPVDLSASTCSWSMGYFGNPQDTVLSYEGVISGDDNEIFTITILSEDSAPLAGNFIGQPVIVDFSGREFRLAQGIIVILPQVPL